MIDRIQNWLSQSTLPLWLQNGVDWKNGGFFESLTLTGEPMNLPRRTMVQSRQLYSLKTALKLGLCDEAKAMAAIDLGTHSLLSEFSLPGGGFVHSIGVDRKPLVSTADLYSQAFALFGMGIAFSIKKNDALKEQARNLIQYLSCGRRVDGGGFTELTSDGLSYQSNPHMHLFEAAIEWMSTDSDPTWRRLAEEVLDLALQKFIDPATGALAEMFSENWMPLLENGRFYYEPGHLYEWSWLMGRYEELTNRPLMTTRLRLFDLAERSGIDATTRMAYDQVWSDFTPRLRTSRFWPQCERVKAACQLASLATSRETAAAYVRSADEAMTALFEFLNGPLQGLWSDTRETDGRFKQQPAKASSLYHIIGAMNEYLTLRPRDRR